MRFLKIYSYRLYTHVFLEFEMYILRSWSVECITYARKAEFKYQKIPVDKIWMSALTLEEIIFTCSLSSTILKFYILYFDMYHPEAT